MQSMPAADYEHMATYTRMQRDLAMFILSLAVFSQALSPLRTMDPYASINYLIFSYYILRYQDMEIMI